MPSASTVTLTTGAILAPSQASIALSRSSLTTTSGHSGGAFPVMVVSPFTEQKSSRRLVLKVTRWSCADFSGTCGFVTEAGIVVGVAVGVVVDIGFARR